MPLRPPPKLLTSGKLAALVGVSTKTINDLVDSGSIPGSFKIPGSKDRRIPYRDAMRWAKASDFPTDSFGVDLDHFVVSDHLAFRKQSELVEICACPMEAAAIIANSVIAKVVVDFALGEQVCRRLVGFARARQLEVFTIGDVLDKRNISREDAERSLVESVLRVCIHQS